MSDPSSEQARTRSDGCRGGVVENAETQTLVWWRRAGQGEWAQLVARCTVESAASTQMIMRAPLRRRAERRPSRISVPRRTPLPPAAAACSLQPCPAAFRGGEWTKTRTLVSEASVIFRVVRYADVKHPKAEMNPNIQYAIWGDILSPVRGGARRVSEVPQRQLPALAPGRAHVHLRGGGGRRGGALVVSARG